MRIAIHLANVLSLAVFIITIGACDDITEGFGEMMRVHKLLMEEYRLKDPAVEMNIENNQILTVTILNSPMNTLSHKEKGTKAREVASFVNRNFHLRTNLKTINVVFGTRKTHFLLITSTVETNYSFDVADLAVDK